VAAQIADCSSIASTATYLGISEAELQERIDNGEVRVIPPHAETLIHHEDFADFMAAQRLERRAPDDDRPLTGEENDHAERVVLLSAHTLQRLAELAHDETTGRVWAHVSELIGERYGLRLQVEQPSIGGQPNG
jgi:hypothetical protein